MTGFDLTDFDPAEFETMDPELKAIGSHISKIIQTIQVIDPGQPITISTPGGELFIPGDGGSKPRNNNKPRKKRKKRRK